ncbi:MAG TPA: cyclic nucleotide-binding domain-containing protein, partial [Solirubrobacteraceae bacterium]|nr:cyclic nucleotide-binding domain-containing protein [Solirubrobacteraceae bacterium]
DAASEIFLLTSGEVTVTVHRHDGAPHRMATLSAGMVFGELATIGRSVRSADVTAHGAVEVRILSTATLDDLGHARPGAPGGAGAQHAARRLRARRAHDPRGRLAHPRHLALRAYPCSTNRVSTVRVSPLASVSTHLAV